MKGILEFSLPDEREEFRLASNATNYSLVLWELDQYLRNKIKYGDFPESVECIYEEIRNKLLTLADDHEVKLS